MLTRKTSQEHYNKYENIRKSLGVSFADLDSFAGYDRLGLIGHFQFDPYLNNIPLFHFDLYASCLRTFSKEAQKFSLAELCCLAKHCLIYQVIKAEPVFED